MTTNLPIHLFIDELLVNELWTMIKREGLPQERVIEISAKIAAKGKFGFGKLWSWLAADVTGEVQGGVGWKSEDRLEFTALFKSLLLRELIPSVIKLTDEDSVELLELEQDSFVEIYCEQVELIALPTLAAFYRQQIIHGVGEKLEKGGADEDTIMSYTEKYTGSERAMGFMHRFLDTSSGLHMLDESKSGVIQNALALSADDHVLVLGRALGLRDNCLLFCIVREDSLRRNLAAYTGLRRLVMFGQVAAKDIDTGLIGISPVTVSLA